MYVIKQQMLQSISVNRLNKEFVIDYQGKVLKAMMAFADPM